MRNFAFLGNGPLTNRGCEAIVLGTKKILEHEFGAVDILLASFAQDPTDFLPDNVHPIALPYQRPRWSEAWWRHKTNRLLRRPENTTEVLKPLRGKLDGVAAAFSIGGDGYAIDYGHLIVDRLVVMDRYVQSLGIPAIIWGASIGPFDREPEFERQMAQHFASLDLIVVREPVSLEYLHSLGVTKNVHLAPDPAFALASVPCSLPERIEHMLAKPCVGVNLSPLLAKYATNGDMVRWTALAADILERLLKDMGLPLLLVPHVISQENNVLMDDEIFLRNVLQAVSPAQQAQMAILPRNLNCENLKWIIGQTSLFIGARAHSTMAALSSCVPCLSLAYSRKAWGINELVFGHSDWVLSPADLTPERLCERAAILKHESERVRAHLNNVVPDLVEAAFGAAQQVKMVISDRR